MVMDTHATEADLARRAQAGDREAMSDLAERARGTLFAVAYAELLRIGGARQKETPAS
jgi:hypothetical protein